MFLPLHTSNNSAHKIIDTYWKPKLYQILETIQKEYPFKILDFNNYVGISDHDEYYADSCHLNTKGAEYFTKLLNDYIHTL